MDVKAKCRNCGKYVNASELKLDPIFRMMVCPTCIKERKTREQVHEEVKIKKQQELEKKNKPADYDIEDDYLEKAYKQKMKETVILEKISDEKGKYACPQCKYSFVYNFMKKIPSKCPYCGSDIARIQF